jgi:hypothetical protein
MYNMKRRVATPGDLSAAIVVASADGAIPLTPGATVIVTKGTAAALTLAAPSGSIRDGDCIDIVSTTAAAHTVTQTTPGFNDGSTASDVATFGAAKGNCMTVMAYNGIWYVLNLTGVTLG